MLIKPAHDPLQALEAMRGPAVARQIVILVWNTHERYLSPQPLERGEELFGLLNCAPQVSLIVDQQQRRTYALDVGDRRALSVQLRLLPRRSQKDPIHWTVGHIAGAIRADVIG